MTKSKSEESDSGGVASSDGSTQENSNGATSNNDDKMANNEASSVQTTEKEVDTNHNNNFAVENVSSDKEEGDSTTKTAAEQQRPNSEDESNLSSKASNSDQIDNSDEGDGTANQTEDCNATAKIDLDTTSSPSTAEASESNIESNNSDATVTEKNNSVTRKNDSKKPKTNPTKHQSNIEAPIEQDFDSDQYSDKNDTLLTMSFNQDGGCLAIGTASGFRICNVHPFQETFRRDLGFQMPTSSSSNGGGGIARIEMLYRTNLLALTGHHSTASHSQYPPNKVLIYDDHSQRTIGELSFRQKILATKLRRDRIVVVLRDRVYVYNFSDLSLLDKVHTGDNPAGLIGLSLDNWGVGGGGAGGGGERANNVLGGNANSTLGARNGMVLACPSTQRGQVRVELYGLRRTTFVDAHESALGALALSVDGSLLATASERGTVIRLYDTRGVTIGGGRAATSMNNASGSTTSVSSSVPLKEFRRGVERATISCLTFSLDSCWLGCASDHGTVHIFQAQDPNSTTNGSSNNNSNKTKPRSSSMTGKAMRMLPKLVSSPKKFLMDGEHSYAQVRGVPHPRAIVFVPDRERTIAVAGTDDYDNGVLLLAEFRARESIAAAASSSSIRGGSSGGVEDTEAKRIGYHRFFKKGGAASMHGRNSRRNIRSSSSSSKDGKFNEDIVEGGAYVDETSSVNLRMNHIRIGDENEDDFVPIDYDMEKK
eukprot:CAMPEP_0201720470 /NCGR_PEP_ID=MMETSP0593-20130828/5400_1 /ASSEMBLY_ACC=CAM_ASM_000672 /TAXON_ID=267983 /ORGANISM="Skeletonema japonicum, Strain CCMP2506" /LENGTH=710 /DNA_ID=CAMNT_0048211109 /DNA_START=160 /DNA_END=2292 /DNA_ORIENTATION=+